jgi:hypothetical protein
MTPLSTPNGLLSRFPATSTRRSPTAPGGANLICAALFCAVLLPAALLPAGLPSAALAAVPEAAARVQELYGTQLVDLDPRLLDSTVPTPESILGYPVGSRPATHREIVRVFETFAATSPRAVLREHGQTHEHRRLVHLIISSTTNMARLDEIQADIQRLADPRGMTGAEQREIIERTPAIAWLGYSIHGDELSGADAAMVVAYRVLAGVDSLSRALRNDLVVIIDPMENPDGRDRYIQMCAQWTGKRPNPDHQSLEHAGFWPWGRTNHYLFDLNRDWFTLVHPESRGRAQAIVSWQPQLFVDAHEMGSFDTFLISPPREPFNPNLTETLATWWDVYAAETATAFDERGWSYYTRAWHEEWFPGYGSSWSCYLGAVGMLYEQARVHGSVVKRPDSTLLTYPETVHHQYVASIANLTTTGRHRVQLLRDFVKEKRRACGADGAFLWVAGDTPRRAAELAEVLTLQGIEVRRARRPIRAASIPGARDLRGQPPAGDELPVGTYVVNLDQPMSPLARAILEIDPRMPNSFLETELHELQKRKGTRLYETTSWSLLCAYGLEAYESPVMVSGSLEPVSLGDAEGVDREAAAEAVVPPVVQGGVENAGARFGYLIDWRSDAAAAALVQLIERGVTVRAARKDFRIGGRDYVRGSLLLRRSDAAAIAASGEAGDGVQDLDAIVAEVARATGVTAIGIDSAISEDGPDLGGGQFRMLREPRVAVAAGHPVSYGALGPLWHLLDARLEARVTLLDLARLGQYDLTKYNVLVLPDLWGGAHHFERALGEGGLERLRNWIHAGGTLIGMGTGADFATDAERNLSQVRLRRHVLDDLEAYDASLERELAALATPVIDSLAVWGVIGQADANDAKRDGDDGDAEGKGGGGDDRGDGEGNGDDDDDPEDAAAECPPVPAQLTASERQRLDEYQRLLHPNGATLVAELDPEHWLTAGLGEWVPVNVWGSRAFMSKDPIATPARLADADELRIAGLLWPEARERWARTAYVTREGKGRGQIILFAGVPNLRAYWRGSERLLVNALLLGPGMGASAPVPW